MSVLALRRREGTGGRAGLESLLEAWRPALDSLQANVFIADSDLQLVYANPKAVETARGIEGDVIASFGASLAELVGGSIRRVHKDPSAVDPNPFPGGMLPHRASFNFGTTILDGNIAALRLPDGTQVGFIVSWDDVTELRRSNRAVAELGSHLNTAATAVEQMGASIQEVSVSAAEAARTATTGVESAESTRTLVEELGDRSREIGQVINVITTIAQQTNLLALNATIEAARAGEFGKGFAVVAGEVKELARGTAEATDEIGAQIEGVQRTVQQVIASIADIADVIARINDYQTSIAGAVEEQSTATGSLAASIGEAAQTSAGLVAQLEVQIGG